MSLIELKALTNQIGKAISQTIDKDNPEEVTGKLAELSALQSTSAHCLALAEMVYNQKLMELVTDNAYSNLSATDKKYVFLGKAKQEGYYVTLSERQSRSLSHSLDALRSILSFMKSELENLKSQTT